MQSRYGRGKTERISLFLRSTFDNFFFKRKFQHHLYGSSTAMNVRMSIWGFEFGRSLHGKVGGSTGGSGAQLEAQWSITARGSPFQEGSSHMSTSQFQTSNSQRKICRLGKRSSVISDGCNSIKVVLWVVCVWGMEHLRVLKNHVCHNCPVSEVKGSTFEFSVTSIWALPVRVGGSKPLPEWFGALF